MNITNTGAQVHAQRIPALTVTTTENVEIKERSGLLPEKDREEEWEQTESNKIPRPSILPIHMSDSDSQIGDLDLIDYSMTEMVGTAIESPSLNMSAKCETVQLGIPRPMSASFFVNHEASTPEYESDQECLAQPVSDLEDIDRSLISPASSVLLKERADSDPSEILLLQTKKTKKTLKGLKVKNSLKSRQKKKYVVPGKDGVVGELALASMKMGVDGTTPKDRKSKLAKATGNKRKKITKMAQKLSERQVLSPSYKQKNEDFHKFFKDLPITERLLVDYACALVKDILVQGRLYVSQNYLCFHSNILKWQTAVTVNLVDIDQMTKEKTVKVIPNAIQVLLKDKTKMTFTSFTARDRAYLTVFRLWQNALLDKPMSVNQLWYHIHRNYGEELGGCSSDDDYVRPKNMPRKHQSLGEIDSDLKYEFGTTNKVKKKKKSTNSTQTPPDGDFIEKSGSKSSKSSRHSSQDSPSQMRQDSTGDDKSSHSSQLTPDDVSVGDEVLQLNDEFPSPDVESRRTSEMEVPDIPRQEESDDEEAEFAMQDLAKVSMNRMYETSARDMYRIIFSDGCPFWKDTLVNKGTTNINFGTWQDHETARGQKIRELSYTLRLDNPIGPKTSFVKETQIFYPCTIEGKSYAVDCFAQNFNIPYADYFQTVMRYCIRKVAKNSCELRITSELRYRKSPWGLIKNFIEKNVASGLTENFRKLEYQLQDRVDFEKSQSSSDVGKVRKPSNLRRRKRKSEASGSELQKSENRSSSRLDDGDTRQSSSDLNNNKSGNSSPDIAVGAPSLHTPNGFLPNDQHNYTRSMSVPKLHYFGQGGKFIIGAIFFIFILLIYSNYSMYHRLTTLEHVTAAAATAEGVDPSVTAALLDRPGVPITSNPEILSTYLQAIDKRLRRLEDTVVKYMQDSNSKWEKMEKNWEVLENMLLTIVKKQGADGG